MCAGFCQNSVGNCQSFFLTPPPLLMSVAPRLAAGRHSPSRGTSRCSLVRPTLDIGQWACSGGTDSGGGATRRRRPCPAESPTVTPATISIDYQRPAETFGATSAGRLRLRAPPGRGASWTGSGSGRPCRSSALRGVWPSPLPPPPPPPSRLMSAR